MGSSRLSEALLPMPPMSVVLLHVGPLLLARTLVASLRFRQSELPSLPFLPLFYVPTRVIPGQVLLSHAVGRRQPASAIVIGRVNYRCYPTCYWGRQPPKLGDSFRFHFINKSVTFASESGLVVICKCNKKTTTRREPRYKKWPPRLVPCHQLAM